MIMIALAGLIASTYDPVRSNPVGGGVYGPTTFLTGVIHKAGAHTFLRVDDPVSRLGFPRRSTEVSPEVVVESQNGEN